jgi:hypothetical protein
MGAVLIGPANPMAAERALIRPPYRVWVLKRLLCRDDCPVPESQLLRTAMRHLTRLRGKTLLFCSYADPAARDERTGQPLLGWLYLAAGFFYAGETSRPRYALIDSEGRARSLRQGATTLGRSTPPPGWRMAKLPPARVWLTVVPPDALTLDGVCLPTTRRWRKHQWRSAWAALAPDRRIAAQQWIETRMWRRLCAAGQRGLCAPRHSRPGQRLQPAWWRGSQLKRTAGPVWVPGPWKQTWLDEAAVVGERTGGRMYLPRILAANA